MDYKQILTDYLSKTLGKTDAEITAILHKKADDGTLTEEISDSALTDLEAAHAEHIEAAPADKLKAEYNRGHKEGTFSAKSKAQERIEKIHGIKAKTLEEAEDLLATKAAQDASTEDKVKTHPIYLNKVSELEAQLETVKAEGETKLQEVESRAARKERFSSNIQKIEAAMAEAGVVMPVNPTAAATLKRVFLEQIQQFDFDAKETGTYLLKADGTLEKDKHGNPVKLESYVKEKAAEYFDIQKQPARQSPGNDNPGDNPPAAAWRESIPADTSTVDEWLQTVPAAEQGEAMKAFQTARAGR